MSLDIDKNINKLLGFFNLDNHDVEDNNLICRLLPLVTRYYKKLDELNITPVYKIDKDDDSIVFLGRVNNCDLYLGIDCPAIIIQYGKEPYEYSSQEFHGNDLELLKWLIQIFILGTLNSK